MTDLARLREIAEKATPGEWEARTSEATMNDRSEWCLGRGLAGFLENEAWGFTWK